MDIYNAYNPPFVDKLIAEKIISGILGHRKNVVKIENLQPDQKSRVFLCEFKDHSKLVIKYASKKQWEKHGIATRIRSGIPKVIGSFISKTHMRVAQEDLIVGWYAQEYIEKAKRLNELSLVNPEIASSYFQHAIYFLIDIHNSLDRFIIQKKGILTTRDWKVLVLLLRNKIKKSLYPVLKLLREQNKFTHDLTFFQETVKAFPYEKIAHILSTDENVSVLAHGDYKPDNILLRSTVQEKIEIWVVDWDNMAVGSAWMDIALLLDILNEKERDKHLSYYLEAQKEKDPRWRNISFDTASKKMKCAYALAELYHAVSNAIHILNGATNPYYFELLTYHINRLEKELEKLET